MISGFITFSSKLPRAPPMLMATSLPMTWLATMVIASLWVGLTLPGMIELPGSFSGIEISPRPLRGPEAIQRTSLAIFISEAASVLSAPWANKQCVVSRECLELVGGRDERIAREPGQLGGHAHGKLRVCVQPRADGRAAQGQLARCGIDLLDVLQAVVEKLDPAGDLLAERERGRVHQVRPADLDDVSKRRGLLRQGRSGALRTDGIRRAAERRHGRDVHRGRKHVVGRLAHVDMVVGMDLAAHAALAAQELAGAVGDDLVQVHVRLGAAARLPDDQGKLGVVPAGDHLVGGRDDRPGRSRGP